jgi:aryl-alcohol dehydrogenase-like predicted oxidoreductase
MTLERRTLGTTGVSVAVLGYGGMELRGAPSGPIIPDEEAGRLLNEVIDSGIDFIDTSIDYRKSEGLIGRYIAHRRDEFFLASKCGCIPNDPRGAGYPHDFTRANIRAGVEHSLRTLQTDHLDLLQLHFSPSREVLEENDTVAEMELLRSEGKVRFIGVSGELPALPGQIDMGVFDVFQVPYSAVQREHEEFIGRIAALGAGVVIRGGTARGQVSLEKNWQGSPMGLAQGEGQRRWEASRIEEILGDMSPMEFVLRFTISHPGVTTAIVGTSSIAHLLSNVAIAEKGPLPTEFYNEALRRFPLGAE